MVQHTAFNGVELPVLGQPSATQSSSQRAGRPTILVVGYRADTDDITTDIRKAVHDSGKNPILVKAYSLDDALGYMVDRKPDLILCSSSIEHSRDSLVLEEGSTLLKRLDTSFPRVLLHYRNLMGWGSSLPSSGQVRQDYRFNLFHTPRDLSTQEAVNQSRSAIDSLARAFLKHDMQLPLETYLDILTNAGYELQLARQVA